MKSLMDLRVRPGEPVKAEAWNALLDWLRASQVVGGAHVRVARTPHGTFITALPGALPVAGAFAVSLVVGASGGQAAAVRRGLVEGVEPKINGQKSGGNPEEPDAPLPVLDLPKPTKPEGGIYLKCSMAKQSWRIEKVEITFEATPPAPQPWQAWKLVAILRRSGELWEVAHQAVHWNLGHYAYGRKPSGKARHLFFAR